MYTHLRDDDINFLRQRGFFHLALDDGDYVAEAIAGDNEFRLFGHGAGFHCIHYNLTHAKYKGGKRSQAKLYAARHALWLWEEGRVKMKEFEGQMVRGGEELNRGKGTFLGACFGAPTRENACASAHIEHYLVLEVVLVVHDGAVIVFHA